MTRRESDLHKIRADIACSRMDCTHLLALSANSVAGGLKRPSFSLPMEFPDGLNIGATPAEAQAAWDYAEEKPATGERIAS